MTAEKLPDVQNEMKPKHEIKVNKVGVTGLLLPIFVSQKVGGYQYSTARIDCCVSLDAHLKGTNMSRIPRVIHTYIDRPLTGKVIREIADEVQKTSEVQNVDITYKFPYFVKKIAPESGEPGVVHYDATFNGLKTGDDFIFNIGVDVTATNLCPCSKEISSAGAHNQRILIKIMCEQKEDGFVWLEELINIAESSSSCEIFSVLKREDERYVTERAYANPMFVEDVVRSGYDKLSKIEMIKTFKISSEAFESIHLHSAYAEILSY